MPIIVALALLAACSTGPKPPAPVAEAFVGPMTLNLREELAPRAAVTATVKHGDRLDILARRRRFVKVRTESGTVGWTDGRQLLSPNQMTRLRRSSEAARGLVSQGSITPFDLLNVHIVPNRQSPSFYQLNEGHLVDLIGHRVAPRVPYDPEILSAEAAPGVPVDPWSRIRTPDGRAGWVLTKMTMMAIPDDVAQYAEGHHITSYFSLGSVEDRGQIKHHWLWTTIANRAQPHHFDSFRVFVWSLRRHRYETAYIERNLRGYYPVQVYPISGREMARFSLNFAGKDGMLAKRTYEFQGFRVRMIARAPWELPVEEPENLPPAAGETSNPSAGDTSLADKLRAKWKEWFP